MNNRPSIRLFDFTMIVISLVIGMGIFRTPVNVARDAPSVWAFFAVWVAGGVVALCGALTYAEIGSRLPVTGGYYKVFSYAYHPSIAFAINCVILVSNAASLAGVALIGGEYIGAVLLPLWKGAGYVPPPGSLKGLQMGVAFGAIALFYGINLLGLRLSARTQSALMIIKITLILLLITPLFFGASAPGPASAAVQQVLSPTMNDYLLAFGSGLVAVSFTYGGYQQTINFGAEVANPSRNLPRGIFFGISVIILLYLSINFAYVRVIGFENLKTTTNIAAVMASKVFGPQAERVLSGFLFLSVLAYVNALLLSNPRVMYAMAEDGILPAAFRRRHPRTQVLVLPLTIFAALCMLIVFWAEEFDKTLSFSIFLDSFGMILSAGSIFVLRPRTQNLDGTGIFKMKWYPLQPVIFIIAYVFVAISLLVQQTRLSLIGLAVLSGFILLYFAFRKLFHQNANKSVHD